MNNCTWGERLYAAAILIVLLLVSLFYVPNDDDRWA
jgi:hypothetical protein